jgi:D-Tyr-tRNAtyr deacylase
MCVSNEFLVETRQWKSLIAQIQNRKSLCDTKLGKLKEGLLAFPATIVVLLRDHVTRIERITKFNSKVNRNKVMIHGQEMMTAVIMNITGRVVVVNAITIVTDDNRHRQGKNVRLNRIHPAPVAFIVEGQAEVGE